jgi:hypothetical protein
MREFYYQVFVSGIALFMMMTGHEWWTMAPAAAATVMPFYLWSSESPWGITPRWWSQATVMSPQQQQLTSSLKSEPLLHSFI